MPVTGMHSFDRRSRRLSWRVLAYALRRIRMDPPLDHAETEETLRARAGRTVTEKGLGGAEALRIWREVLAPACISVDHPRFFSYVPAAPTEAAGLFDVAVSAANVYAGSWQEGAGAVFAENETLRWLADLAGLPPAWIGVGTLDLFHTEDLNYARRLEAAGVACDVLEVPGAFHGFDKLAPNASISRAYFDSKCASLRRVMTGVM